METPKSLTELRQFMGVVNELGKFIPNIAELSQPLHELSSKRSWVWGPAQDAAFKAIKIELARPWLCIALMHTTKIATDCSA